MSSPGDWLSRYMAAASLEQFAAGCELWSIEQSNARLRYLSHGFFRYFGKFPPPVAARFIRELHDPTQGPVVDPMCGSGTTLVEALLLGREAIGLDVNPLSLLIARVKTTPLARRDVLAVLADYERFFAAPDAQDYASLIPQDRRMDHWFYPETQRQIARTRYFIERMVGDPDVRDLFKVALAANIRRFSRASNGLGRMFLDAAIPPQDVALAMRKKVGEMALMVEQLQPYHPRITLGLQNAQERFLAPSMTNLVICHPPYFNLYKYSSIYKYELLWLGFEQASIRRQELREGFKLGKKELVSRYVDDLGRVLCNIEHVLASGGRGVLMIGDTIIHGERINTTQLICQYIQEQLPSLAIERLIIRQPKFTEASYAAGQRRQKEQIGVKLQDHLLVFQKG